MVRGARNRLALRTAVLIWKPFRHRGWQTLRRNWLQKVCSRIDRVLCLTWRWPQMPARTVRKERAGLNWLLCKPWGWAEMSDTRVHEACEGHDGLLRRSHGCSSNRPQAGGSCWLECCRRGSQCSICSDDNGVRGKRSSRWVQCGSTSCACCIGSLDHCLCCECCCSRLERCCKSGTRCVGGYSSSRHRRCRNCLEPSPSATATAKRCWRCKPQLVPPAQPVVGG